MARRGTSLPALAGVIMLAGAALPAGAQEPAQPSYEAALRRLCPAKNLDFLPDDQISRTLAGFIRGLPEDRRRQVIAEGRDEVAACQGQEGACSARAAIAVLRRLGLAPELAKAVCALPVRCTEVSECGPDTTAAAPVPPPGSPPAEPDVAPVGMQGLLSKPPRPASPRDAALGFYRALGRGDGIGAEWFVIPEKRGSGAFVASDIERFYGSLPGPLTVVSAEQTGPSTVEVRYRFVTRGGGVCDGRSTVNVRDTPDGYRIARIDAPSGC